MRRDLGLGEDGDLLIGTSSLNYLPFFSSLNINLISRYYPVSIHNGYLHMLESKASAWQKVFRWISDVYYGLELVEYNLIPTE
jgi:hypothetical protein